MAIFKYASFEISVLDRRSVEATEVWAALSCGNKDRIVNNLKMLRIGHRKNRKTQWHLTRICSACDCNFDVIALLWLSCSIISDTRPHSRSSSRSGSIGRVVQGREAMWCYLWRTLSHLTTYNIGGPKVVPSRQHGWASPTQPLPSPTSVSSNLTGLSPTRRSTRLSPTQRSTRLSPTGRLMGLSPTRRSAPLDD
jgi:hypothetical protein